jgi:uncharacterized integral membrane protein
MADQTSNPKTSRPARRLKGPQLTRILVGAAALIYGIIFVVLNRTRVRIHFVFFTVTSRLWVGFVVCLVLGALLGQALGTYRKRSRQSGRSSSGGSAS